MKKAGIILIIVWSIVAVGLAVFLAFALTGGVSWIDNNIFSLNLGTLSIEPTSGEWREMSKAELDADDADNINIEWVAGDIIIKKSENDKIIVTEYCRRELSDDERAFIDVSDGTLMIGFKTNKTILRMPAKKLVIEIPEGKSFSDLHLESVSSDIDVSGLSAESVSFESVSGKTELSGVVAEKAGFNSISGEITAAISGCRELDAETVSGKVKVALDEVFENVDIETVSGSIQIMLPPDSDFALNYEKISGNLENEFPTSSSGTKEISVETVSGSLKISAYTED